MNNSRGGDGKEDPPYSRLFVVCSKNLTKDDLKEPFEKHGDIEDIYMLKDKNTGASKGVAYIKFRKTSSAAAAIQDLHLKTIGNESKPIKVMVASAKNDFNRDTSNEDRYKRLFIKINKQSTYDEVRDYFSEFGRIESIHLQKDKVTNENKGFAYVTYKSFLEAAKAFERCDSKYKPVFAIPKDELKRSHGSLESQMENYGFNSPQNKKMFVDSYVPPYNGYCAPEREPVLASQQTSSVLAICSPQVPQKCIERLFNIVPGMQNCKYSLDSYNGVCKAFITYSDECSARQAVDKINNFEFPYGELITVKLDVNPINKAANELSNIVSNFRNAIDSGNGDILQLADAIAQASALIRVATTANNENKMQQDRDYCSVDLPPPQPLVGLNKRVAQRCFVVCRPHPPTLPILRDVFCRFGDLIDVLTFPNRSFGYVKYASIKSAQEAIKTLHGATVCGIHLKVMEADEKPDKTNWEANNIENDNDSDCKPIENQEK